MESLYIYPSLGSDNFIFKVANRRIRTTFVRKVEVLYQGKRSFLLTFAPNRLPPKQNSYTFCVICCTCTGAWLGTFVIPLDWERPWQVSYVLLLLRFILF
eukprot:Colp12_sorted_trinity150504_noHs@14801